MVAAAVTDSCYNMELYEVTGRAGKEMWKYQSETEVAVDQRTHICLLKSSPHVFTCLSATTQRGNVTDVTVTQEDGTPLPRHRETDQSRTTAETH